MKLPRQFIIGVTLVSFFVFTQAGYVHPSGPKDGEQVRVAATNSDLTPLPGDPLRKAILDALRQEVKRAHGMDIVFVVRYLKVKNGWAWVHTLPQSPDGGQQYEDLSALLKNTGGLWKVVVLPCTEVDNPDCLDSPGYFPGLKKRFPGAPSDIFPN